MRRWPTQDENPINAMLQLLLRFSHHLEGRRPEVVYNIRELSSSQAGFVVPERCEAWLDNHLPPAAAIGEIMLELEELLACERQENPHLDATLRFATIHSGYQIPEKGALAEALKTLYAQVCTGHGNRRSFVAIRMPTCSGRRAVKPILLGPGQLEKAHAPDESVSFQQVCLAAQLYFELLASSRKHGFLRFPQPLAATRKLVFTTKHTKATKRHERVP